MSMKSKSIFLSLCLILPGIALSQTIAEKKAGLFTPSNEELSKEAQELLTQVNRSLDEEHRLLRELYNEVYDLFDNHAPDCDYKSLLDEINAVRRRIGETEENFRLAISQGAVLEDYSLFHQPNTTLEQLVIDYGSQDFVYLIPQEVSKIKVSINSSVPIPRASWQAMLDTILMQNGVGIRQLNPFLRELFLAKEDNSSIKLISNNSSDLDLFPPESRICFVLSPEPAEIKRSLTFLEKFLNPNTTRLQIIGRDILILGPIGDIKALLKLYDFMSINRGDKEYKVIALSKVKADDIAKVLGAIFDQMGGGDSSKGGDKGGGLQAKKPGEIGAKTVGTPETSGLKVITMGTIANAVFLVGTKEEIKKAEEIIKRVEAQVGSSAEKIVFWYTAKHSDPGELAETLQKIYGLMMKTGTAVPKEETQNPSEPGGVAAKNVDVNVKQNVESPKIQWPNRSTQLYAESFYQSGGYIVNPRPIEPTIRRPEESSGSTENFIVDPKTGSIVMVIEANVLPKIKELIRKLDVPKKMVQIETLLFEKRVNKQTDFGLNLLKVGDCASNCNTNCLTFNNTGASQNNRGVLEFFLSRSKCDSGLPAYDYFYRFLLSQQDVQLNAAPSVITINQTPAMIAINEEISINTGVYAVDTVGGVTLQDAFTRAQYGINIQVTPTIHMKSDENNLDDVADYITLESELTFDTIQPGGRPERPDVIRRQVKNNVRIADGQSVIIGGLRRKVKQDDKKAIPFIGELPGVGKFFSFTDLNETSTELFVIMTPKIIVDPAKDYERIRRQDLCKRPGDIPEFLCQLADAELAEKRRTLEGTMTFLFGRSLDRCMLTEVGEFDGRR
jgi:general secretion pathway protein D